MRGKQITKGSGAALVAFVIFTNAYSVLPAAFAGNNVWISHMAAEVVSLLCLWALTCICDKHGEKSFGESLANLVGGFCARCLAAALAVLSLLTLMVSLTVFSRFVQITALPATPQIIIPTLLVITAALSLRRDLHSASGGARLLIWFFVLVFFVFCLGGMWELSASRLFDGANTFKAVAEGAGEVYLNRFATSFALMSVYTRMPKEGRRKWFLSSAAITSIALSVLAAITVATLGKDGVIRDYYPVYSVMSLHGIGGFIRHTEILACIAMTFSLFFKSVVCILFTDEMLSCTFKSDRNIGAYLPLGLLSSAATYIIYRNSSALRGLLEWKSEATVVLAFYIILPLLLLFFSRIKKSS